MKTLPKIITENPHRIMGVYGNSSTKEIMANKSKALAFCKVGKEVKFPTDIPIIMPLLKRTAELINEASTQLFKPEDRLKHAQFWFLLMTEQDNKAFEQLQYGELESALRIWAQEETFSSLQNQMLCYFLQEDNQTAISTAEQLYEQYGDNYLQYLDMEGVVHLSSDELLHNFIETLCEQINILPALEYIQSPIWIEQIKKKIIQSTNDELTICLNQIHNSKHKDPEVIKDAGEELMCNSREPLRKLRTIVSKDDMEYQFIADKVGSTILDCCIEYINNSDTHMHDKVANTFEMIKYAKSIVVGRTAKQRCMENYELVRPIATMSKSDYDSIIHRPKRRKIRLCVIFGIIICSGIFMAIHGSEHHGFWYGVAGSLPIGYIVNKIMKLFE